MARLNDIIGYKSKYLDENDILKNKLDAKTIVELEKKERLITNYKLADLYMKGITGKFDVNHYLSIHKFLFGDIYDFAGKIRSENIAKAIPFCLPHLIYENLEETLKCAKRDSHRLTNEDQLIEFMADYYAKLDIIHPFREGNGRCEREFFRQYMLEINKMIDFGLILRISPGLGGSLTLTFLGFFSFLGFLSFACLACFFFSSLRYL